MISVEEIKHLAKLTRIEVSAEETAKLQQDLNAIFDYVVELRDVPASSTGGPEPGENFNQLRPDDVVDTAPSTLLGADFVRVKKIL